MKDNMTVKVSLNVIQRIFDKKLEVQEVIDASMTEVCSQQGVFLKKVFFLLFLCYCLYHNGYSRKKLNNSVKDIKTA